MNSRNGFWLTALIVSLAALFQAGCEVTSERRGLTVTQSGGAVRKGESVTLVARGGSGYVWRLAHDRMGFLNTRQGDTVIYTSRFTPDRGEEALQIVTVMTGSGSGTNTTGATRTAEAYISHLR